MTASPGSPLKLWKGSKCSDKLFFHLHEHLFILWLVFVFFPPAKHVPWFMLLRNFELLGSLIMCIKSKQVLKRICKNTALLRVQDAGVFLLIKITCFHFDWEFLSQISGQEDFSYWFNFIRWKGGETKIEDYSCNFTLLNFYYVKSPSWREMLFPTKSIGFW